MESLPNIYELYPDAMIDANVGYDLNIAKQSFEHELYPVTIFYCAIALEEQLCAIYEIEINENANHFCNPTELKDMSLYLLIEWAKDEEIFETEFNILHEIRLARNFFGHAVRIMGPKTKEKIENGSLDFVVPNEIDHPEWFKDIIKFHETTTGDIIDPSEPAIGWLDSSETAHRIYHEAIRFVSETEDILRPR